MFNSIPLIIRMTSIHWKYGTGCRWSGLCPNKTEYKKKQGIEITLIQKVLVRPQSRSIKIFSVFLGKIPGAGRQITSLPPFPFDMNIILFLIIIRIINIFSIYEGKFVLLVGRSTSPLKIFRYQNPPPTPPHKKKLQYL